MLKLPLTYNDIFDDEEHTEIFLFNFSKVELLDMQTTNFGAALTAVVDSKDPAEILPQLKNIILMAYGERDGDRFVKSDEIRERFAGSPAFEVLYLRMLQDAEFAGDFITGVIPKEMRAEVASEMSKLDKGPS